MRFQFLRRALPLTLLPVAVIATAEPQAAACQAQSGSRVNPVLELYTSEGCSSCPPADQWLSGLKEPARKGQMVVQAFHVGYWDYIGWVDRFAAPAHTARQREIAAVNGLRSIYTPQLVRDGRDWRDYAAAADLSRQPDATVQLRMKLSATDDVVAEVVPAAGGQPWSAYWSVTEHGHSSRVKSGENAGEFLRHDFVVRQYVPVGRYSGTQTLKFSALPARPGHARQINLVVHEPRTGMTLQALSLGC